MALRRSSNLLPNIESGLNPINIDTPSKVLDLKTTTINGVIKLLTEDILFKRNSLDGLKEFEGQVYRVTNFLTTDLRSFYMAEKMLALYGQRVTVCKVRIPEIHAYLPIPSTFDLNEEDSRIINLYPDFLCHPTLNNQSISIGDIVNTTFGNLSNFSDPKILARLSSVPQGQGTIIPAGASERKGDLKKLFT